MPFGIQLDLLGGLLVFIVGLIAILGIRLLIAYINAPKDIPAIDAREVAFDRTAKWAMAVVSGFATAVAVGLVQFGDAVGMVSMFIGSHPLSFSNVAVAGIGAGIITGLVELSLVEYLGLVVVIVGATLVLVGIMEEAA